MQRPVFDLVAEVNTGAAFVTPDELSKRIGGATVDVTAKVKRRSLIIEMKARQISLNGHEVVVLEGQNVSRLHESEALIDSYAAIVERRTRDLERERVRVEKLLLNILPRSVYEEYMSFGSVTPRLFEPVSVLMLDFVGFGCGADCRNYRGSAAGLGFGVFKDTHAQAISSGTPGRLKPISFAGPVK